MGQVLNHPARTSEVKVMDKNDPRVCVFEHAEALRKGETVPLTLTGPSPGLAICAIEPARMFNFLGIEVLHLGASLSGSCVPLTVSYSNDDQFLSFGCVRTVTVEDMQGNKLAEQQRIVSNMIVNVDEPHNEADKSKRGVTILEHIKEPEKKKDNPQGRKFVVNDNGTITLAHMPHLAIGLVWDPIAYETKEAAIAAYKQIAEEKAKACEQLVQEKRSQEDRINELEKKLAMALDRITALEAHPTAPQKLDP